MARRDRQKNPAIIPRERVFIPRNAMHDMRAAQAHSIQNMQHNSVCCIIYNLLHDLWFNFSCLIFVIATMVTVAGSLSSAIFFFLVPSFYAVAFYYYIIFIALHMHTEMVHGGWLAVSWPAIVRASWAKCRRHHVLSSAFFL